MAQTPRRALHPPWTHAPLGGVLAAAVFDVISAVDEGTHAWARELYRAGTFVLMVSTTVMALAIASGLVDRFRGTAEGSRLRSRATVHGVIMAVVTAGSVLDLTLRRTVYPRDGSAPALVVTVTLAVLVVAAVGGELGARLTYRGAVSVMPRASGGGAGEHTVAPATMPSDGASGF